MLSRHRPSPLLPNLYRIECGHLLGDSGNLYLWSLLLSRKLRDFCIQTADDETAASALTHLRLLSPHLRSITICLQFGGEAPYTLSALSDTLLHLTELRSFGLLFYDSLPITLLPQLASLPYLENLALCARYDTSSNAFTSLIPRKKLVFRSLDRLTMHACSVFAACTAFVKRAQFPPLTHIILEIESEIVDDVDPLPYFEALHDSCSTPAAVTEVSFTDFGLSSSSVTAVTITLNSLYLLLACRNLQDVKVKTSCGLALDNNAVKDIAMAWPQLSSLYLMNNMKAADGHSNVTLRGLTYSVQYCPKLHWLAILVDASQTDQRPSSDVFTDKLTHLILGKSRPGLPSKVALFLSDLFHNLTCIGVDHEVGSPEYESWVQTRSNFSDFAAIHPEQCGNSSYLTYVDVL